jgi:plasmid stabilization system protein ParE
MAKTIVVSSKAAVEIRKAAIWYDEQSSGLSQRFMAELDYHFRGMIKYPDSYKRVDREIQRCLMKVFPYIIYFSVTTDEIVILRVRHTKRKPLKRF